MAGKKRALILRDQHQHWAESWLGSFALGLERHGWEIVMQREYKKKSDLLIVWGQRFPSIVAQHKDKGGEVCMLERGYLGDRLNEWASVSFGGELNNKGIFRGPLTDGSRWQKHFSDLMKPWRLGPGYALVLGQVPGDKSVRGVDLPKFYRKAVKAFADQGMRVRFRQHPVARERKYNCCKNVSCETENGELSQALDDAALTVSYNSNGGVLSVLAGVPTVAMDKGSMAWDVSGHDLRPPPRPDRLPWAHALAWKQWRKDEMVSGECWEAIGA